MHYDTTRYNSDEEPWGYNQLPDFPRFTGGPKRMCIAFRVPTLSGTATRCVYQPRPNAIASWWQRVGSSLFLRPSTKVLVLDLATTVFLKTPTVPSLITLRKGEGVDL